MDNVNFEGISIFEVIDYIYCPRIIYYEKTLKRRRKKEIGREGNEKQKVGMG